MKDLLLVCVVFVLAIPSNLVQAFSNNQVVCVVFVLAIPSNRFTSYKNLPQVCVVFVLAIPSNTHKYVYFFIDSVCCICFSNTLKLIVGFHTKTRRVCCICFSNTLKQDNLFHNNFGGVCCICFSNTLKLKRTVISLHWVCVVFVLAIPSNAGRKSPPKRPCVLYLF